MSLWDPAREAMPREALERLYQLKKLASERG